MRNAISSLISLVLIAILVFFSFNRLRPDANYNQSGFDMNRAMSHIEQIGQSPHSIGTTKHAFVRNYIVQQLQKMDLQVQTQEGFVMHDNGLLVKPTNIIARIEGTDPNAKALLLLSHYDSAVHSAYGASDAASGVATILESVRVFLSNRTSHTNDIIILFTDAEEIGLNGAQLFVNEHEWSQDVGLVLNFEARGSGGPSNMIVETNGGNANLIKAFDDANVSHPVATSLMYSIYKMLPNDTDSTVFREDGDINSFFFAFIDDHYDYHTSLDNPQRLDKESLAHQASYLVPTLKHFSSINLENLNAENDDIYFDLPFSTLIHYPFSWIMPMLFGALLLFVFLIFYGFKKKRLSGKSVLKGFLPFLASLIVAPGLAYYGWSALRSMYPQYKEILQGFTYNGHTYILAFVFLSLAILWLAYAKLGKTISVPNLMVAPLFFWILICGAVAYELQGAAYFLIPVLLSLVSFWLCIKQERPSLVLLVLINACSIFIFVPLIQFFPVGLGLKMLYASALLTVLLFGLLLPIFGYFKLKKFYGYASFLVAIICFGIAHLNSGFTEESPKPNSLVYNFDHQTLKANWNTYDRMLDDWTKAVLGEDPTVFKQENTFSSKYNSAYTFTKSAEPVGVPEPSVVLTKNDTSSTSTTTYNLKIAPNRDLNRMEFYTQDTISFKSFKANGKQTKDIIYRGETQNKHTKRWNNHVLTYYLTDGDTLRLEFETAKNHKPKFMLYEASNTLLSNPEVPLKQRPKNMIPKPFILNDAIISKYMIDTEAWNYETETITPNAED